MWREFSVSKSVKDVLELIFRVGQQLKDSIYRPEDVCKYIFMLFWQYCFLYIVFPFLGGSLGLSLGLGISTIPSLPLAC